MDRANVVNFGAGPSALPLSVLEEAAKGLINYNQTGIGITELSHRSQDFKALTQNLEQSVRNLLNVPDTYAVLFTQGGGTGQFSAAVLNLLARHRVRYPDLPDSECVADYVVTGSWSKKAAEEARRLGGARVNVVVDARDHAPADRGKAFTGIPSHDTWKFSPRPAFVYYCENETVDGVQFPHEDGAPTAFPFHLVPPDTPIVADYSSSFLSRPIPRLTDHAVIYAGAQKNVGPAGLTIVIARRDIIVDVDAAAKLGATPVPITMSYKTLADSDSVYNTPPMFPMYVAGLVLAKLEAEGGLIPLAQRNKRKAGLLYSALVVGEKAGKVKIKVQEGSRSWMNVTFEMVGENGDQKFLEGAEERGFRQLKGHRSVGGIRASLYNAVTEEQAQVLADYVVAFLEGKA